MPGFEQFGDRADRNHAFVGQHRHPVANRVERIEIVGDEEHRQSQGVLQFLGQPIELVRPDRVQPGSRFIEEQQFGIERERTGKAGALLHPARKLGRVFVRCFLRQARQKHLVARDLAAQLRRKLGVELAQRHFDILAYRQRGEQRAALEQHPPAVAHTDIGVRFGIGDRAVEHFDMTLGRLLQTDDRAHQHRLAGARTADHAEDLAPPDLEIEVFVHGLRAETVDQPLDNDRIVATEPLVICGYAMIVVHQPHPISVKNTAKKASSTITAKMAETTAMVVRLPTSSEFPSTCIP